MRRSPLPRKRVPIMPSAFILPLFWAGTLLSIIILSQMYIASGIESEVVNLSSDADPSKLTEGDEYLADEGIPVHVYITNNDNERLDVSLFIDSELVDRKEISSESDQKIDSYPLEKGRHSFKITWWDEDAKSSFETEEVKDITAETSVNLYTILNDEPEDYEITVNLVNENSRELEAFLYADGSFKKSKKVGKESSAELGKIKLEQGIHNLSVRWQDGDTRIEYEKRKKIIVRRDEAVIFYAPKGISFAATDTSFSGSSGRSTGNGEERSSAMDGPVEMRASDDNSLDDSGENNSQESDALEDEPDAAEVGAYASRPAALRDELKEGTGEKAAEEAAEKNDDASRIGFIAGKESDLRKDSSPDKSPQAKNANSMIGGSLKEGRLYIYAALILLAIYLLIRH